MGVNYRLVMAKYDKNKKFIEKVYQTDITFIKYNLEVLEYIKDNFTGLFSYPDQDDEVILSSNYLQIRQLEDVIENAVILAEREVLKFFEQAKTLTAYMYKDYEDLQNALDENFNEERKEEYLLNAEIYGRLVQVLNEIDQVKYELELEGDYLTGAVVIEE